MGRLDQPLDTFWQLFYLPEGGADWRDFAPSLATATNGGLEIATARSSLVVSVRSSHRLEISPVVATPDGGRSWRPGFPLLGQVDRLASDGHGGELALTQLAGVTALYETSPTSASWRLVARAHALLDSPGTQSCRASSITAIGFASGSLPLVGAACTEPGVLGLFVRRGGR